MSIQREELQELQRRAGVRAKILLSYTPGKGYALRQCNGIAAQLFGMEKQDLSAEPVYWADMTPSLHDYVKLMAKNLNGKLEQQLPSLVVGEEVKTKYFGRLYIHSSQNAEGEPETWLFMFLQNAANWSSANQEGLNARKLETIGELASGVAHDFNNLIMGIQANAERLLSALNSSPDQAQLVINIIRACSAGSSLTRSLLGYAKRQPLTKVQFDAAELIKDVANIAKLSLSTKHTIVLDDTFTSNQTIPVVGCYSSLSHCLINLIKNAREAMPEGGEVRLAWSGDEHTACLEIIDSGNGITPENLESIFEPFYSTKKQGTGLGLAMVQGIMSQHEGEVKIASQPGVGTEVTLVWPRFGAEGKSEGLKPDTAELIEKAAAVGAVAPITKKAQALNGGSHGVHNDTAAVNAGRKSTKQILNATQRTKIKHQKVAMIIDDDELVRDGVEGLVQHLGFQTVAFEAAEKALESLNEKNIPDIILVDFNMPGMDGSEFIRYWFEKLPALYREYGTRIILISGFPPSHFQELTARFASSKLSLLQKPFSMETLSRKIQEPERPRSVTGRIAAPMPKVRKPISATRIRVGVKPKL